MSIYAHTHTVQNNYVAKPHGKPLHDLFDEIEWIIRADVSMEQFVFGCAEKQKPKNLITNRFLLFFFVVLAVISECCFDN